MAEGSADMKAATEKLDELIAMPNSRLTKEARIALLKAPEKRTTEDIDCIHQAASGMPAFDKFALYTRKELCRKMIYEQYRADDIVFNEGDDPDGYYFIMSGSVYGLKKVKQKFKMLETSGAQIIFTLRMGMAFGEGAMLQSGTGKTKMVRGKRGATIQAAEPTELLKISLDDYVEVLDFALQRELDERVEFLSKRPLFQGWKPEKLKDMARLMTVRRVLPNKTVFLQGSESRFFYIIRKGQCKIVQELEVPSTVRRSRRAPDEKGKKLLHIATLGEGEYFGEMAIVLNTRHTASVITATKVVLYELPKAEFTKYITDKSGDKSLDMIHTFMHEYPASDRLIDSYKTSMQWQNFKRRLVKDVLSDKQHRQDLMKMKNPYFSPEKTPRSRGWK